jgi:hypothetical protein
MNLDRRKTWWRQNKKTIERQESVNAFNASIKAFMVLRNKNTFIGFLTFSDIYVCFTLFIL